MNKKLVVLGMVLGMATTSVFAQGQGQTLADVVNNIIPQLPNGVAPLLEALSYIFGLCLGIKGVLKLKEHNESKGQQVKLSVPLILIVSAVFFLSLPKLINTGIGTLGFDKGGRQTFKF